MKEYLDKDIKNKFGRAGFFAGASQRLFELNLLGGEEFLERNKKEGNGGTKLEILKDGSLEINTGSRNTSAVILENNLVFITIEKQDDVFQKKNKSVIGRAAIGGLLLGPVGAVVGGMTGIGDKTVKGKKIADYLISFKIIDDENSEEKILLFGCIEKNFQRVQNYLTKNFKDKIMEPEAIIEQEENGPNESKSDRIEDLIKLKELLTNGLLTKKEFEIEKQKLLNS